MGNDFLEGEWWGDVVWGGGLILEFEVDRQSARWALPSPAFRPASNNPPGHKKSSIGPGFPPLAHIASTTLVIRQKCTVPLRNQQPKNL